MTATNILTQHFNSVTTSYVTSSITLPANTLIIVAVGANTNTLNTPTLSGCGMTWVQIATTQTSNHTHMILFRGLSSSPTAGALTATYGANQANVYVSVNSFTGSITTGANGADAIVQSGTFASDNSAPSPAVTLAALNKPVNSVFGAIVNGAAVAFTAGAGFTELSNVNDQQDFEAQWKNIGQTSVNWTEGNTPNVEASAVAIEIAAGSGGLLLSEI